MSAETRHLTFDGFCVEVVTVVAVVVVVVAEHVGAEWLQDPSFWHTAAVPLLPSAAGAIS